MERRSCPPKIEIIWWPTTNITLFEAGEQDRLYIHARRERPETWLSVANRNGPVEHDLQSEARGRPMCATSVVRHKTTKL